MANEEHLAILKKGVEIWNKWNQENLSVLPDLCRAILAEADLNGADLNEAILSEAFFREANLSGVNLNRADFSGAVLTWLPCPDETSSILIVNLAR